MCAQQTVSSSEMTALHFPSKAAWNAGVARLCAKKMRWNGHCLGPDLAFATSLDRADSSRRMNLFLRRTFTPAPDYPIEAPISFGGEKSPLI